MVTIGKLWRKSDCLEYRGAGFRESKAPSSMRCPEPLPDPSIIVPGMQVPLSYVRVYSVNSVVLPEIVVQPAAAARRTIHAIIPIIIDERIVFMLDGY
jgi:hypothetical protein